MVAYRTACSGVEVSLILSVVLICGAGLISVVILVEMFNCICTVCSGDCQVLRFIAELHL